MLRDGKGSRDVEVGATSGGSSLDASRSFLNGSTPESRRLRHTPAKTAVARILQGIVDYADRRPLDPTSNSQFDSRILEGLRSKGVMTSVVGGCEDEHNGTDHSSAVAVHVATGFHRPEALPLARADRDRYRVAKQLAHNHHHSPGGRREWDIGLPAEQRYARGRLGGHPFVRRCPRP